MKKSLVTILSTILILVFAIPASAFSTIAVKSIKLNNTKISLKVGQTSNLKVTFTPANTTQKKLTYVTANKNIATIDANGIITGIGKGTTTITVYTFNKKIYARCNVTVTQLDLLTYNVFSFTQSIPAWVNGKNDVLAQYIENKFKIKVGDVSYLQGMTFKERMNLYIASDELPDVVSVFGDNVTCPASGRYAELGSLIKQNCPNYMKLVPEKYWSDQLYNGRLYSMGAPSIDGIDYPNDPYAAPNSSWACFYTSESVLTACGYKFTPMDKINKQINASGKKPNADLYKIEPEIKTPDDLYEFFKKIKQTMPKVNGQEVIPFSIPIWLEPHFGFTFGLNGTWKYDVNTKKVNGFLADKNAKAYWEYMNKLYNEGLLDRDFASQKLEQMNEKILQGRIKCFMWSSTWPQNSDVQKAYKAADPNDCIRAIRLPVLPGANAVGIDHQGKTSGMSYFINKDFKDITRLLKYWDWTLSKEAQELFQWGPESLGLWEMKDGKKVWKSQELKNALLNNDTNYLKTNYWSKGLMANASEALQSKTFNNRVIPWLSGYNPYGWTQSYKYQVAADDYLTQAWYVSAGGNDSKGYASSGGDEITNKVCDFVYGEFEQTFSPKLFAAKNSEEFNKNWEEVQKYWNEKINYPQAKKNMEIIFKMRGFNVVTD